ncbi:extracellular solute-binding protein [Jiangella asiatica]|uniref:Extracellular solute-binding protein n=1 Tax=Jiangella asiatica TaxID=2530372 RepID=A0A4R5CXX0_9ACTN|nr:extracellular solute-binding protein [Jiangella asiatica]TDE02785.1 extracellular solute-binding protein [Jiangella asiatica]
MRKFIRILSALTVGSVLLAACGGGDEPEEGEGGTVQLTVAEFSYGTELPDNDPVKAQLAEELGVDVELSLGVDPDEYWGQLATTLASGDAPDLFFVDRIHLHQMANQGLLLDLTDYIDEDLGTFDEFVGEDSYLQTTINDKVYALPKRGSGYNPNTYWIRKDWLDNLNLEIPESVDDLMTVAKAFTEQDPDGNGQSDTYGLTGATLGSAANNQAWYPIWGAFGSGGPGVFYEKNGEIVNGFDDPATKDALEYINSLVGAGVVDPDYATNTLPLDHERAMQGMAGIINIEWPRMQKPEFIDQFEELQPDAEWVQIAPMAGPGGSGAMPLDLYTSGGYAVPASLAEDEEKLNKIFELMNYISTEDGNRLVSYGIEGSHFELAGDQVTMTEQGVAESEPFWLYQFSGRDEASYLKTKFDYASAAIDFAWNQPTMEVHRSLVTPPEGYNDTDAATYAAQQVAQFINGSRSLDEWDAFVDELKTQFGYQQYIDAGTQQLEDLGVAG